MYEPYVLENVSDADITQLKNHQYAIKVPYDKGARGYGMIWVPIDALSTSAAERKYHQHDVALLDETCAVGYVDKETGVKNLDEDVPSKQIFDAYENTLYRGDYTCGDWSGKTKQEAAAYIYFHREEVFTMNFNGEKLVSKSDPDFAAMLEWSEPAVKNGQSLAISRAYFVQTLAMAKDPMTLAAVKDPTSLFNHSSNDRKLPNLPEPNGSDGLQYEN